MIQKIVINMTPERDFMLNGGAKLEKLNPKEMLLYAAADCAGRTILGLLKIGRAHV